METINFAMIQYMAALFSIVVEFLVGDQVYLITGDRKGGFERHIRPGYSPTRSNISEEAMKRLLAQGRDFRLMRGSISRDMSRPLNRQQFLQILEEMEAGFGEDHSVLEWLLTLPRVGDLGTLAECIEENSWSRAWQWDRGSEAPFGAEELPDPFVAGTSVYTRDGSTWVHLTSGYGLTANQEAFLLKSLAAEDLRLDDPRFGPDYIVREWDSGDLRFGKTDCVEVGPKDDVVYAHLGGRHWGRFVRGRRPARSSWLTAILRRQGDSYIVHRAFVGRRPEAWPCDRNSGPEAWKFWASRALVWGAIPAREETIRYTCPWYR